MREVKQAADENGCLTCLELSSSFTTRQREVGKARSRVVPGGFRAGGAGRGGLGGGDLAGLPQGELITAWFGPGPLVDSAV